MKKLTFSPSIFTTWLRRYWVASALMALIFIFIAVGLNSTYAARSLYSAGDGVVASAPFIAESGFSFSVHVLIAAFAIIISMLCFGYLKNIRAATMIHSLPYARESLFLSASGAGLCLLFVPILFAGVLFAILQGIHGLFTPGPLLLFLGVSLASALFYFFVSAFVGMLTGNTIAQGLLTLLLLFLPWILEGVITGWCGRYLFGWAGNGEAGVGALLNPFYQMFLYLEGLADYYGGYSDAFPVLAPVLMLVVGLAFALLAVLLYRIRRVEAAGDIIAMRGVRPFFRYILALFFALLFSAIFRAAAGWLPILAVDILFGVIGGFVGYFIAEMFIRRSLKVFRHFLGGVYFAAAYTVILLCIALDAGGYGRAQLSAANITAIGIPSVSMSARSAMAGNPYYAVSETPDIKLPPSARSNEPLPAVYAAQIIEHDNALFKGEDMDKAVALQNLIAQNAARLQSPGDGYYSGYDYYYDDYPYTASTETYYVVEVEAKRANGGVFSRVYRFTLEKGEMPELQALYGEVSFQTQAGNWQNTLDTIDRAATLNIHDNFSYTLYDSGYDQADDYVAPPDAPLTAKTWGELLAAYQKDLDAAWAAPPEAKSLEASTVALLEVGYNGGTDDVYWGSATMEVPYSFEHTVNWLVANKYIDAKALEGYATSFGNESAADDEPIYGYDDFDGYVVEDDGIENPYYEEIE